MSLELEYGEDVFCDLQTIGCQLRRYAPNLGVRFALAARRSCEFLCRNPFVGRPRPEFGIEALRSWAVAEFRRYLIFYIPTDTRLQVLRVLHGSRDLAAEFNL